MPRPSCEPLPKPPNHLVHALYETLRPHLVQAEDTCLPCKRSLQAAAPMQAVLDAVRSRDPKSFDRHIDDFYIWRRTSKGELFTSVRNAFQLKAFSGHDIHIDGWSCRLDLKQFDINDGSCLFSISESQEPRHPTLSAWYQEAAQYLTDHTFRSLGILPAERACFYVMAADGRDLDACLNAEGCCWKTPLTDARGQPMGNGRIAISNTLESIPHIIGVIAHELIHAVLDEAEEHGPRFRKAASKLGLEFLDHPPDGAADYRQLPDWVYKTHETAGTPPDIQQPEDVRQRRGSRRFVRFEQPAYPVYIPALDDGPPDLAERDRPPI